MKKLRKLSFTELTKSEMKQVTGGFTDPRPYSTTSSTTIVGITFVDGKENKQDHYTDDETTNDYQMDYA
ncbi:TIGR04149 family rSAM-modified RiPP [Sphingobacterium detergens]|uniref:Bacteriocin-like protein/natural product n=1 Tax=Sphingobacterium detergens TaxID=1145106 RepID=A0A420BKD8_SPHD1|nr:TIGR04149 family rSAM-modified RiPP [Sphingobacterium detergens]RKE57188.1 bacteriocin-like protein/natural product precursor [Sphingobacterium detergens]